MNWKVCYKKSDEDATIYTEVKQIEESTNTKLKVEFPCIVPDNTHCYYYSKFNAFDYDILHFDGIDTLAEIFINGKKITTTENNFRQYEISDQIVEGENEVVLYVHPKFAKKNVVRDINLRRRKKCAVKRCSFEVKEVDVANETAKVYVEAEHYLREDSIHDFNKISYVATIKDDKKSFQIEGEMTGSHMSGTIDIQRAKIWWPKNFGKPFLYDAQLSFFDGNKLLDVYDEKIGLYTEEANVGQTFINGKKVSLCGPLATDFTNRTELVEKLSSSNCNCVYFPKSFSFYPKEDFEEFKAQGILPIFTNTIPEDISAEDVKVNIEKYRITKQYPPIWNLSDNKETLYNVKCVLSPILVAIDQNTKELYCVNDLPYGDNITYTIKDLSDGMKLIDSGIVDIPEESVTVIGKPVIQEDHNYLINWTTNSGKSHENHFFPGYKNMKNDNYTLLLKACGYKAD